MGDSAQAEGKHRAQSVAPEGEYIRLYQYNTEGVVREALFM